MLDSQLGQVGFFCSTTYFKVINLKVCYVFELDILHISFLIFKFKMNVIFDFVIIQSKFTNDKICNNICNII